MKAAELQATIEAVATLHETNGAAQKAALLRAFNEAIAPLAGLGLPELLSTLSCGQAVDRQES